jgi:hypothetical protein
MYPLRIFAVLQVLLIVASISSVSGMVNISSDTVKQVITDSTSPDFLKKAVYDRSNDTVELDFKNILLTCVPSLKEAMLLIFDREEDSPENV